jgi:hypothetical protein
MRSLDQILAVPGSVFVMLLVAAFLEVSGDAFFQSAVHRTSGFSRYTSVAGGVVAFSLYGLLLNLPRWNFGRLLGIYVVLFFLIAQVIARLRFHEPHQLAPGGWRSLDRIRRIGHDVVEKLRGSIEDGSELSSSSVP